MTNLSNLFIAGFLLLVAASAAVTGSMILLALIDRLFRKRPLKPIVAAPEEEEGLEEWSDALWTKDAAHDERIRALLAGPEIEPLGGK